MTDYAEIMETAIAAAHAGGGVAKALFNEAEVSEKETGNLVTEADVASEKEIKKIIQTRFPDHAFLGEEEGGEQNMNAANLWIVDPIDGTNNYAHSFPFCAVSVAFCQNGTPKVGVVFDFFRDETFTAEEGHGAFLNGKPIHVSNRKLSQALVCTGFYYDRGNMMRKTLASVQKLAEHGIHGIRRTGSAALDFCYVAAGRFDAYFEYKLGPWDFAAGMLIATEAGGKCFDAMGKPMTLTSKTFSVTNKTIGTEFIELIRYSPNQD